MNKLINFKNSVFALVLSIIINFTTIKIKFNTNSQDSLFTILMIGASFLFLITLYSRHKANMDHPLICLYSFFLFYISLALLIYTIFPYNVLGAILSMPAIVLVIFSIRNFLKIYKKK